jgi:hypothetical protein
MGALSRPVPRVVGVMGRGTGSRWPPTAGCARISQLTKPSTRGCSRVPAHNWRICVHHSRGNQVPDNGKYSAICRRMGSLGLAVTLTVRGGQHRGPVCRPGGGAAAKISTALHTSLAQTRRAASPTIPAALEGRTQLRLPWPHPSCLRKSSNRPAPRQPVGQRGGLLLRARLPQLGHGARSSREGMGGGPAHGADVTAEVVRLRDATRVSKAKTDTPSGPSRDSGSPLPGEERLRRSPSFGAGDTFVSGPGRGGARRGGARSRGASRAWLAP